MIAIVRKGMAGLLLTLSTACVGPFLMRAPLERPQVESGKLYPGNPASVKVTVRDERAKDDILGGGIVGPNGDEGKGIFLGYLPASEDQLPSLMEGAAKLGLSTFGFTEGPAYSLEVRLKESRIDMYRYTGFSPMNCIGYLRIETSLQGPDGVAKTKTFNLAYFENTSPVMSMKEVAKEAVSRIFHQATVEVVIRTLQEQFPGVAEPAALARTLGAIQASKEDVTARELVFLLGLTGGEDAALREGVISLYRSSKSQRVRQGALEAVGMLRIASQVPEVDAMLLGKKKVGEWDNGDTEEVWYMLKVLHLLGEKELATRIPATGLKGGVRLKTLLEYFNTGVIPRLSSVEVEELKKARLNVN